MIGKIKGIIDVIEQDNIIMDVMGIGYVVHVSSKVKGSIKLGSEYSFFTIHHIYENGVKLYGFVTQEEKHCAQILSSVKGISYKIALNILSSLKPGEIKNSIINKDHIALRVPGVGEKLVQRIMAELHEKILTLDVSTQHIPSSNLINDATSVLVNLGYNSKEANTTIRDIIKLDPDIEITEAVRLALRSMK